MRDEDEELAAVDATLERSGADPEVGQGALSPHASPVRVVGLAAVFLLVLGVIGFLAVPRGGALDAPDLLAELFEDVDSSLPFGLDVVDARRLPSGERVVRYVPGEGAPQGGPVELTIIEFPAKRGEKVLNEQFRGLRFDTGEGGPGRGGRGGGGGHGRGGSEKGEPKPKLREKGFLDWHGYEATYARLRHVESASPRSGAAPSPDGSAQAPVGGVAASDDAASDEEQELAKRDGSARSGSPPKFYETMRLNLSTGGRCVVAYIRFREGVVASKAETSVILAAFSPRS